MTRFRLLAAAAAALTGSTAMAAPVLAPPAVTLSADVQPYVHIPAGQIAIQTNEYAHGGVERRVQRSGYNRTERR